MSIDQDIANNSRILAQDVGINHAITHGDENTEVQTEGGPVPTNAKVAKDSHDEIVAMLEPTVGSINDHAAYVTSEADRATSQAEVAKTARNEAEAARDDAEAIVHEGEGSTTPGGGKYPVAYADGQIDSGWLPGFEARFPYSGVIGSVDKHALFYFDQSWSYANKLGLKRVQFSIAGRLVDTGQVAITLPEAESTAGRRIAFDDIFIDWHGNIDTYRSTIPHRTITGYDADAIASEHGYTSMGGGLYKTGDSYALFLCRVARRNQGAFHPLWNPEGTAKSISSGDDGGVATWYADNSVGLDSVEDCFNFGGDNPTADTRSTISDGPGYCGRPETQYSDAIYADDLTPLYYSANTVLDRQALLFDSFNRAMAGETFMGAEGGVSDIERARGTDYNDSFLADGNGVTVETDSLVYESASRYDYFKLLLPNQYVDNLNTISLSGVASGYSSGSIRPIIRFVDMTGGTTAIVLGKIRDNGQFESRSDVPFSALRLDIIYFESQEDGTTLTLENMSIRFSQSSYTARPHFMAVDIIGSLDSMPQEWLDNGLPGNWLAEGEEGEDLIPDGTEKNFKLARKCLACHLVLSTTDNGATWSDRTDEFAGGFEGSANAITDNPQPDSCMMVFYRTAANPFALAERMPMLAFGDVRSGTCNSGRESHALVCSNLVNKICVNGDRLYESVPLLSWSQDVSGSFFSENMEPEHSPITQIGDANPAFKALPMLAGSSDGYRLAILYKELRHDGQQWGDDHTFDVVDNQAKVEDTNGVDVVVGHKALALPYHFTGEVY